MHNPLITCSSYLHFACPLRRHALLTDRLGIVTTRSVLGSGTLWRSGRRAPRESRRVRVARERRWRNAPHGVPACGRVAVSYAAHVARLYAVGRGNVAPARQSAPLPVRVATILRRLTRAMPATHPPEAENRRLTNNEPQNFEVSFAHVVPLPVLRYSLLCGSSICGSFILFLVAVSRG